MKTLYLECGMGAAGDMLTGALLELIENREAFLKKINGLGLPGVGVQAEKSEKCGVMGTHIRVTVHGEEEHSQDDHGRPPHNEEGHHHHEEAHHHEEHPHHHHHASPQDIEALIRGLPVSDRVKSDALAVYRLIAEAESRVHGKAITDIHFHEVGTLDAVTDVVSVCLLMEEIGADQIVCSPVQVGSGYVRCAHGILPVPSPATALILSGAPTYGGEIEGELCTPTGAALLRHFAASFGDRPLMTAEKIGYGMGTKDFERANCLRAFLGESEAETEKIVKLECNLDDMTGEDLAYACRMLMDAGARDAYTVQIGMKKSRPGVMLCCVCLPQDSDAQAHRHAGRSSAGNEPLYLEAGNGKAGNALGRGAR